MSAIATWPPKNPTEEQVTERALEVMCWEYSNDDCPPGCDRVCPSEKADDSYCYRPDCLLACDGCPILEYIPDKNCKAKHWVEWAKSKAQVKIDEGAGGTLIDVAFELLAAKFYMIECPDECIRKAEGQCPRPCPCGTSDMNRDGWECGQECEHYCDESLEWIRLGKRRARIEMGLTDGQDEAK